MKINILLVLLLVVIMNGFCQSIHFDFLMRAVKCNNYMHFEDFMKSKESGFKFDTSLSPRNFTLINKYLSTKETPFNSNVEKPLQDKNILTYTEHKLSSTYEINYITFSKEEYTALLREFEKKGFKAEETTHSSPTQSTSKYNSDSFAEVVLAINIGETTDNNQNRTSYTFTIEPN